jgi:hypothetical protein
VCYACGLGREDLRYRLRRRFDRARVGFTQSQAGRRRCEILGLSSPALPD